MMETVAFCETCGRGSCWVDEDSGPHVCMDSRCGGLMLMLALPEPGTADDDEARWRRLQNVKAHQSYVRPYHRPAPPEAR